MKISFQSRFIMLVLALIITIPTINSSSFSQEENTQGQEQQKQKIQSSQSGTQNLTDKYEWPNIHENVLLILHLMYPIQKLILLHSFIHLL